MISSLPVEVRSAALKGWRLHPLVSGGKTPLLNRWQKLACNDLGQLERWNVTFPGANWGVATGPESGLFVIDLDGGAAFDWLRTHIDGGDQLPESWAVRTKRGLHLYFAYSAALTVRNSAGKLAQGVDVRGDGGFVVIPPSRHPDGPRYTVVDDACPVSPPPSWIVSELQTDRPRATVAEVKSKYDCLCVGQRNDGLTRLGGSLRRRGRSQADIEKELAKANLRRCIPPLNAGEVVKIAASVSRYPIGGPDLVETLWGVVESEVAALPRYDQFLLLAKYLQEARTNLEIVLPLKRIASLMGVHYTSVQQYRKRAVATGALLSGTEYIPHRRAGQYRVPLL